MNKVVYRHRRLDTNEVFYVGIGKTKKRAYSKRSRNPHWHNIVNKYGYTVEIIAEVETWEEACELECLLIQEYGRKDLSLGPLVNKTDGGEGIVNRVVSEEARLNMSLAHRGKPSPRKGKTLSEETKQKLRDVNLGKKLSEEHKAKIGNAQRGGKNPVAKKVINTQTGVIYDTIKEASLKENIKNTTLWEMLNGKRLNKTNLILINKTK